MRKYTLIFALLLLMTATVAIKVDAAPKSRFDPTTETCRVLDDGPLEWASRPWGSGGQMFKDRCKTCHSRDNGKGAPYLWEESKTSKGWNRVFAQKYPQCAKDGSWGQMTQEQQLVLNDYLYRWAKNSQDLNDSC